MGKKRADKSLGPVMTIGHSTRPLDEFISLLQTHGVTMLVDVRTVPRSRHNPQFNKDSLPAELKKAGLKYTHMPGLGGLRHARADSPNKAWRNLSFRGYADYMQTPEFKQNVDALVEMARHDRLALMCAEAVPWRCHRSLIADALVVRGVPVRNILSAARTEEHSLRSWAKVKGKQITYPPEEGAEAATATPPAKLPKRRTRKTIHDPPPKKRAARRRRSPGAV